MDENDKVIINELKRDSRVSLADVSRELQEKTTHVMDKLAALEQQYLKGYTVVLDYPAMGYHCMALLLRTNGDVTELVTHLTGSEHVNNVSTIAGRYDVMCEMVFATKKEYDTVLEELHKRFSITDMELLPQLRMDSREGHRLRS